MTRDEAAGVLGVSALAGAAEIRYRYQELYSDFQIRLTNAPTPSLKRMYQKNLQEIEAASKLLLSGGTAADTYGDLPSAEPLYQAAADSPMARQPSSLAKSPEPGTRSHEPSAQPSNERADSEEAKSMDQSGEKKSPRLRTGAMLSMVLIVLLVAAFLALRGNARPGRAPGTFVPSDTLASVREDIAVAHVHLDRGEYRDAAALVDSVLARLSDLSGRFGASGGLDTLRRAATDLGLSVQQACAGEVQLAKQRGHSAPPCR